MLMGMFQAIPGLVEVDRKYKLTATYRKDGLWMVSTDLRPEMVAQAETMTQALAMLVAGVRFMETQQEAEPEQ